MLGAYLLWAGLQDYYARSFQDDYWLSYSLFTAAGAVWAVAVARLVIRDGGWRLDRAARSVLTGLLLATGLTTLFVVSAAVLSGWLVPGRSAAGLTLIALVFGLGAALPRAARWAVGLVDRLYYGDRAQPYQVLRTLAGRVRQVVDPERLPAVLCGTVAEELRLPGVALSVTTRAGPRPLAAVGRTDGPGRSFALVHRGTTIGELTVGLREGEERLEAGDVDILRSLADQVSPAVASLRLQEDLQASREQIVAAREEERRWLRRDIHDGLGPALAGLRLRVDNAASAAGSADPGAAGDAREAGEAGRVRGGAAACTGADVARALVGISEDLAMAIKEVRRITDRLGPAPLGEFGLARAVQQLALTFSGAGLAVTAALTPDPLPALPAAVEVAVYRITAEALNNVLHHARAGRAEVVVRVDDETLTLTVQDDGVGYRRADGDDSRAPSGGEGNGVGIRSMADRAAEIGGSCTIGPLPLEHGTRVRAVLPASRRGAGPGRCEERRRGAVAAGVATVSAPGAESTGGGDRGRGFGVRRGTGDGGRTAGSAFAVLLAGLAPLGRTAGLGRRTGRGRHADDGFPAHDGRRGEADEYGRDAERLRCRVRCHEWCSRFFVFRAVRADRPLCLHPARAPAPDAWARRPVPVPRPTAHGPRRARRSSRRESARVGVGNGATERCGAVRYGERARS